MEVQLESTVKIVQLTIDGQTVPARIWEGETANGVKCHAYITRIAVANEDESAEFERDLKEHVPPSPAVQAFPARMVL
jgi:hypothetical protein